MDTARSTMTVGWVSGHSHSPRIFTGKARRSAAAQACAAPATEERAPRRFDDEDAYVGDDRAHGAFGASALLRQAIFAPTNTATIAALLARAPLERTLPGVIGLWAGGGQASARAALGVGLLVGV
jgi:hypothetical protein